MSLRDELFSRRLLKQGLSICVYERPSGSRVLRLSVLRVAFGKSTFACSMVRAVASCIVLVCSSYARADFLAELRDVAQSQFPGQPAEVIEAMMVESLASALDSEGIPNEEVECSKDYSTACPTGWIDEGDGGSCSAPPQYAGPCPKSMSFDGLSAVEKISKARRCGASFPCVGACTVDYGALCPNGWEEGAGSTCVAPLGYAGPCVLHKPFTDLSPTQKADWAKQCKVAWPCRSPQLQ